MSGRLASLAAAITVGASAVACAAASSSTPAAASGSGCAPAGARILASSPTASAFSLHGVVYGCSDAATRYRLGTASFCIGTHAAGPVTVVGRLAAYGLTSCGIDTGSGQLIVRRLTDGKQLFAAPATTHPLGAESYNRVDAVVLKSDGAVAWIGEGSSIIQPQSRDIEVRQATEHGSILLDSGGTVKPRSLELHGSKLTWRHGSSTRSATLN